jgi:O-antigen/teichoic acid export membrane protein
MDQGLFAMSNFAVNVMLARWLSPEQYGSFAIVYSILLLIGGFHNSFFTEPMLIFGSGKYASRFSNYLSRLYKLQWQALLVSAAALVFVAGLMWSAGFADSAQNLSTVAAASPLILSMWFSRRACYTQGRVRIAAVGSGTYFVLVIGGVVLLQSVGLVTTAAAFVVMAAAGLIVSLMLHRTQLAGAASARHDLVTELGRDHIVYGRWALAATVASWVPNNVYYFVLPLWSDLGTTGALKALLTLTMPISQVTSVLGILVVPHLVRIRNERSFALSIAALILLFGLASVGYWLIMSTFRLDVVRLLFGQQYVEIADLVVLIGILPILASAAYVSAGALRALERPDLVFRGFLASTFAATVACFVLVPRAGLVGAIVGLLLAVLVKIIVLLWLLVKERRKAGVPL